MALLKVVDSRTPIIGFNILKFDVPFILIRSYWLKRGRSSEIWESLFGNKRWVDLYQLLGDAYFNLRDWATSFGRVKISGIKGEDIPELYIKKKYGEIASHLKEDLALSESIYRWWISQSPYRKLVKLQQKISPRKFMNLVQPYAPAGRPEK